MAGVAPTVAEVNALYRALLREARKFPNYNIREYIKNRSREGFRQNKQVASPDEAALLFAEGETQLEVARRQSVVYAMFAPRVKTIMEIQPCSK